MNKMVSDINLSQLLNIFNKGKVFIFFVTSTFAIISLLYAVSLSNIYKSEVLLEVADKNQSAGINSSLGGIASFAGLGGFQNMTRDKAAIAFEILKSKNLARLLAHHEWISQGIMAVDYYDIESNQLVYDERIFSNNEWIREVNSPLEKIPSYQEIFKVLHSGMMNVSRDSKTGLIRVSLSHQSPIFAKQFLDQMIVEVNEYTRSEVLRLSRESLLYLEDEMQKNSTSEIRRAANELIKDNLETEMLAKINQYYFINPIDGPHVPLFKSSPTRSIICISITLIGFFLSLAILLVRHVFIINRDE